VSFAPNETSPGLPDIVFNMHREDIALGAKARLLAKKNKPAPPLKGLKVVR
jgi:hypothetical protein